MQAVVTWLNIGDGEHVPDRRAVSRVRLDENRVPEHVLRARRLVELGEQQLLPCSDRIGAKLGARQTRGVELAEQPDGSRGGDFNAGAESSHLEGPHLAPVRLCARSLCVCCRRAEGRHGGDDGNAAQSAEHGWLCVSSDLLASATKSRLRTRWNLRQCFRVRCHTSPPTAKECRGQSCKPTVVWLKPTA